MIARAIAAATAGTFDGTREIVEELVRESKYQPCWRPARAAAMAGLGAKINARAWMTPEEFRAWFDSLAPQKRSTLAREAGIGLGRRKSLLEGARISGEEALAIAHFRAGLPRPLAEPTPAEFQAWFVPRFGAAEPVARVLGIHPKTISAALCGFSVERGQRRIRTPTVALVRALDWVWRVGPFSPYGDRPWVDFPGQLTE